MIDGSSGNGLLSGLEGQQRSDACHNRTHLIFDITDTLHNFQQCQVIDHHELIPTKLRRKSTSPISIQHGSELRNQLSTAWYGNDSLMIGISTLSQKIKLPW